MDPLIDVNVYVSRWPFRRVRGDETPALVELLRRQGVTQAWAGSFDALLHRDMAGVNARLAAECREHGDGLLLPFGAIHPMLPDWEDDVRRCHEQHGMPGVRLHPNYHGYKLDDPVCGRLLELAERYRLIVQIALTMEDERTQHPLVQVPHVDAAPLTEHARRLPQLRLVLLNAFRKLRVESLDALAAAGNVSFDVAMLEGVGGVGNLVGKITADRIVFGSYAPFYYVDAALLKLRESPLGGMQRVAIAAGNAQRLLPRS
ncbi:MAG: amidohydrolase family protein [Pirellulaceae bacterium]